MLLVWGAVTAAFAACTRNDDARVDEVIALAPAASREIVRHLVVSDDSTLTRFARGTGIKVLSKCAREFCLGLAFDSEDSYVESREVLLPLFERLAGVIARVYQDSMFVESAARFRSLSPTDGVEWRKAQADKDSIFEDRGLTPEEKIARLEEIAERFSRIGMLEGTVQCNLLIAELYTNIGESEAGERVLRATLPDALQLKSYNLVCQHLGVLGAMSDGRGEIDSMRVYYDRALKIAHRYRLPNQAARITSFYAGYYIRKGRFALAHQLLSDAIELCRSYGGGGYELRYICAFLKMHADLGGWEIVGRLMPRARTLIAHADRPSEWIHEIYVLEANRLQSRYLMAVGRVEEASTLNRGIDQTLSAKPYRLKYSQFLLEWAEGLVDNGRGAQAMDLIARGGAIADEVDRPDESARFLLLRARVLYEQGKHAESLETLGEFERVASTIFDPLRAEQVGRDALVVRNRLALGDTAAAAAKLEEGLRRVERFAAELDPSAHGYLWVSRCDELRQLFHGLAKSDPTLGYGFEIYWREIFRVLGSGRGDSEYERKTLRSGNASTGIEPSTRSTTPLFAYIRTRGERARAAVVESGAVHCVYVTGEDNVWRWTCTREGIRRESLEPSRGKLNDLVTRSWRMMATDPGDTEAIPAPELVRDLRALSRALLPPEVLDSHRPDGVFLVTADRFLSRLPFETLDLSARGDYRPLVTNWDVAYIRHAGGVPRRPGGGPTLVVTNAGVPDARRGRYNSWRELPEARAEARTAAAALGTELLEGALATKSNILSRWETASFLYFAGHFSQDADAPYLTMLPLATPGPGATLDAASLDILDVRAADLSACGLVVLSGCSSGAPYVGRDAVGPSFGDAFLDAGAGAVVQTAWEVRDDQSRVVMEAFTRALQNDGSPDAVRALRDARLSQLAGPRGVRHPFFWAAYTIALGEIGDHSP